jgi:hypothetical protein
MCINQRRRLRIAAAGAIAMAAVAFAMFNAPDGFAVDEVNDKPAPLGQGGLTEGQTLRVSVANVVAFDPQPDPPRCLLRVGFVDSDARSYGVPDTFELRPGTARTFDPIASGQPHEDVRPVVSDTSASGDCPAVVTTQIPTTKPKRSSSTTASR